jgi:hypothetical protein
VLLEKRPRVGAPVRIDVDEDGEKRLLTGTISEIQYGVDEGQLAVLVKADLGGETWELVFPCSAKIL